MEKRSKLFNAFLQKAMMIHSDKYDYSLVDYKNSKTKIKIICPIHGMFEQTPEHHLITKGCSKCGKKIPTNEQFIEKSKQIHGDKYDYSLVDYKKNDIKVKIKCNTCGNIFEQRPIEHLDGSSCPYCAGNKNYTTEEFIEKAKQVHGDKYDYSLVEYVNKRSKVIIKCKICGNTFTQLPGNHLSNYGCSFCNSSRSERDTELFLKENNIAFEKTKKYEDLKDKDLLSYDFYLPNNNLLIECNGIQHYEFSPYFHGTYHDFHRQLHHDWLKRKYAKDNNINLLVIPCWENIKDELRKKLL